MKLFILVGLILTGLGLLACAPKVAPAEKPALPEIKTPLVEPGGKEAWEVEWQKALEEARKEGKVVLYIGGIHPEVRNAMKNEIKKEYGLELELVAGRGPELAEKILRERRAGLYLNDAIFTGAATMLTSLKPQKALALIEPMILLPEVKNPAAWYAGKLPFVDKEKLVFAFSAYHSAGLNINREQVKEEVKSLKDVLNPKWKEKIIMEDPTIPGQGWSWFAAYGTIINWDYMRELAKQRPFISRDQRQIVEWLAQGKYPVALGGFPDMIAEFQKAGIPIEISTPGEGGYLTSGFGNISILDNAPHPEATLVFLNWLLSKKGQALFNTLMGYQSARVDVAVEHLASFGRKPRQPGEKYLDTITEEFILGMPEHLKLAREIFGQALR